MCCWLHANEMHVAKLAVFVCTSRTHEYNILPAVWRVSHWTLFTLRTTQLCEISNYDRKAASLDKSCCFTFQRGKICSRKKKCSRFSHWISWFSMSTPKRILMLLLSRLRLAFMSKSIFQTKYTHSQVSNWIYVGIHWRAKWKNTKISKPIEKSNNLYQKRKT